MASSGDKTYAMSTLRKLSLQAWGELLWEIPTKKFPSLSNILPAMSSVAVQNSWTGANGKILLNQTIPFVRYLLSVSGWSRFNNLTQNVLDYGCGYGRISRLMLKYFKDSNLFGADPWKESIELVHAAGFGKQYMLTDEVPAGLPFSKNSFDLIWAFSVFTHLAPSVAIETLKTLNEYLTSDGILVITIRPIEYWEIRTDISSELRKSMKKQHELIGYSFVAHNRTPNPIYGITYGDISMSLESLAEIAPNYKIVDVDRSDIDPYQIYVTLKKRNS